MADAPKVLIAEDDHFLSSLLKARLEKENFLVKQTFDGEETLSVVKEFEPNLIVLDLIMPRLSGFEFLEKISIDPQYNQIPVIVVTNLGQDNDVQKAKRLGVEEYFVKAKTSIDDLVVTIKGYVKSPK